jgi:arylsulfatase A-like enzyme
MDEGIGRILDRLEEKGLAENTLVIFTSDNGMSMGHHGIWGKGNATFPMNMYDTAVKVPFLIRWPGHTAAGSVCDDLVSAYDLFPTIAEITGFSPAICADRPGRSFLDAIEGKSGGRGTEEVVVYDEYGPVRMIRTKEWKYIHRYPYGPHELYDLTADPGETRNLAEDPREAGRVIDMRRRLQEWFARYADPAKDGLFEDVTGSGQLCRAGIFSEKRRKYAPNPK